MKSQPYDSSFYKMQQEDSSSSAKRIVPFIIQLLQPKTIIDVGCGVGTWSNEFMRNGVTEVLGVDGDYVDRSMLHIPEANFRPANLSKAFDFGRFDLTISVEVAEHLPESAARSFIRSLTASSDYVVFSAAHPGQGGVDHINEQWPSYWASIFKEFDFSAIDAVRPVFWWDKDIQLCYRHNVIIFAKSSRVPAHLRAVEDFRSLDLVHPERWDRLRSASKYTYGESFYNLGIRGGIRAVGGGVTSIAKGAISKIRRPKN